LSASSSTRWLNSSQLSSRLMKCCGLKGSFFTPRGRIVCASRPGSQSYESVTICSPGIPRPEIRGKAGRRRGDLSTRRAEQAVEGSLRAFHILQVRSPNRPPRAVPGSRKEDGSANFANFREWTGLSFAKIREISGYFSYPCPSVVYAEWRRLTGTASAAGPRRPAVARAGCAHPLPQE